MFIQIYDKSKYKKFTDARKNNDYRTLEVPDDTNLLVIHNLISTVQSMCNYKSLAWLQENRI
ncbi:hypothetical protein XaC1_43 [Xanthomonas phage XaC1]|nr:hypothetical protein XaC1_43 [Xanthomonas phage XaC1]